MDVGGRARDVLIVGWYPGADDPIAGRFIADQAAALAASGRVRPWVASFEPFWLHGDRRTRARAAGAWPAAIETAARAGLIPTPSGAFGPAGIPVARIGTPIGTTPGSGRDNEVDHRTRMLEAALHGMGKRVELIHGHVGYPEGAAAGRNAARLGVPFVLTEHATYLARILADPVFRARYREAGLAARRVIAVGRMLAEQIATELPELADRLVVIPNTVDIAAFPVVGAAERHGNELLWVGYRREVKGTGILLRAFARVRESRPATTLRLVGRSTSDEEEAGWHALARDLGVADAVRFEPPAGRAGVVEAMSRAGIFVHPGFRETFGMVAVEALASGLPVVATDSGGVTEVLGDDPDAFGALAPVGDPEALAAAIIGALDRRESFDPARLRDHVESRYAAPVVASRLADLYDEVLADRTTEGRRRAAGARPPAGRDDGPPGVEVLVEASMIPARPILVAFDRSALDRLLPRCPEWLLDGLVVVTRGDDVPGVGETIAVPAHAANDLLGLLGWRSAGSPLPSPVHWLHRLRKRGQLQARVMPALTAAVERGLEASRTHGRSPASIAEPATTGSRGTPELPLLICLGGIDVVAAQRRGPGRAGTLRARWAALARGRPVGRRLGRRTSGLDERSPERRSARGELRVESDRRPPSVSQFQRSWAARRQRARRSARAPAGRSRIERRAVAIAAGSEGSQTAPSGPSGSSTTIRRRSGKSLETTGTPAAMLSKSLLGVLNRLFWSAGRIAITSTSAPATHDSTSAGSTAGRKWTRPPSRGSARIASIT